MRKIALTTLLTFAISGISGLINPNSTASAQELPNATNSIREYKITSQQRQTIDGFGASDAWSMQFLGLWDKDVCNQVADWLFSTETDSNGNPKGIGLSIWRFNVGAGSWEQGNESQINRGTRTECFRNADGTYNWEKQYGQRHFLKLAKERGVNTFLAFLNSPPVHFTQNGLATNTGRGGTFNLKEDKYEDFATFIADVIEGVEQHDSIHFNYLCPVNEPDGHWNWLGPKQEGTPATNREIAKAVRLINKEFSERGITTKILVSESSDYRCMFSTHIADWQRGYEIQSFFSPDSTETYLGNLSNVPKMIVGHSYWTNTPLKGLHDYRQQLADSLNKYNLDFWQTETCIMSNDEEIGGGGGYDFTMKTAIYVARIIHHDIVIASARSWQWWRAAGGDYRDGLIRMYDREKKAKDSKLLWIMGNYSRFIRPGAVRLSIDAIDDNGNKVIEGDTNPTGVMCSAYSNADGKKVIVAINYSESEQKFKFSVDSQKLGKWNMFRTSDAEGENLKLVGQMQEKDGTTLTPRSVTTFVEN